MSHKLYYRIPYVLTPACFGPCVALWSANLELEIFCAKKGSIFILESRMYAKRMQRVCTSTLSLDLIDGSLTVSLKQKRTKTLALSGSFFWPALSWQPRSSTPLRRSPLAALAERSQRRRRSRRERHRCLLGCSELNESEVGATSLAGKASLGTRVKVGFNWPRPRPPMVQPHTWQIDANKCK